ncbi:MAG: hypothetical protein JSW38_01730 [Dehalococcoidia bacterium]|nr:MAG: hypothetical protein JSW38_01730 [Dehalococcoidia bacterium]
MKLKQCLMNMDKCEDCYYWEPIPFHDSGGVCMAKRKMGTVIPSDQSPPIELEAILVKQG